MSKQFYYGVYLPSIGRKVYFRELTIAQLKDIIKTILNNDDTALYFCFNDVIKANCREDIDALGISIFDRFIILLTMRVVSMGNAQKIQLNNDIPGEMFTTTIDYNEFVGVLEKIEIDENQTVTHGLVSVEFGVPLASRVFHFDSLDNSQFIRLLTSVKKIKVGETNLDLNNITLSQLTQIVESLPNKINNDIQSYLDSQERKINKVKFLDVENPYNGKKIEITMSLDHWILDRILKLAFKDDLHALYKAIYYMVNVLKFTPEYVESLTYNERQLFWSYHQADEREREKTNSPAKPEFNVPPMRDAMADFEREM